MGSSSVQKYFKLAGPFSSLGLLCHWLSCVMGMVGAGWTYVDGIYFTMTTLTSVGYGDITPKDEKEKFMAMLIMIVGCAFYGNLIGTISSTLAQRDRNTAA